MVAFDSQSKQQRQVLRLTAQQLHNDFLLHEKMGNYKSVECKAIGVKGRTIVGCV